MAALKEAAVYIIDLGSSMGECHNGRVESDLDYGMQYVWDKLAQTLQKNRKDSVVGVVGVRTDETENPLSNEEGYNNISVLRPMSRLELKHLEDLRSKLQPNEAEAGDTISAIVLAEEMIKDATTLKSGPGKFERKIVLLTNGHGSTDDTGIDSIAKEINKNGIQLVVVGIDFDDADYGFKEEDKSEIKENTESLLKQLVDSCDNEAVFATAAAAIESTSVLSPKQQKPYPSPNSKLGVFQLGLGDFESYPAAAVSIEVKRFFKTKIAKVVSAKSGVTPAPGEGTAQSSNTFQDDTEMTEAPSNDFVGVKTSTVYTVDDPEAPGGKKTVDRDELARGYAYGRTAVYFGDSEVNITDFETYKSFSIIGFIPSDGYEKYLTMGEACITIAQPTDENARLAFSSLVHALHELDSYAVARLVVADDKKPNILLLAPWFGDEDTVIEALIDVPLPFQEDVRIYKFPPLDRVINSSGAALSKHRYLPSEDLESAMSEYIDKMDLSTFGKDDEGQPIEYMKIDDTFSPAVHRINQAIRQRAMHPDKPLGPPPEVLTKWSIPPSELVAKAMPELQRLIKMADLKPVPPKVKGKRDKERVKPLSGLDVDEILNRDKKLKISRENAIPDFKQMLKRSKDDSDVNDAAKQMGKIIRSMIADTTGHQGYEQALAYMRVFRNEMIEYEFPQYYNNFLQDLKGKIINSQLGDDNKSDFWYDSFRGSRLGLIDKETLDNSEVTEEEAKEFMRLNSSALSSRGR